jgi:hypothetical protein
MSAHTEISSLLNFCPFSLLLTMNHGAYHSGMSAAHSECLDPEAFDRSVATGVLLREEPDEEEDEEEDGHDDKHDGDDDGDDEGYSE